jgi:hypothetical protein
VIPENDWYGHKQAMADYCGVPSTRAFLALLAHGWTPDLNMGVGERTMRFAPFFVWNEHVLGQARERGVPNVHCIGAPFSYLVEHRFPNIHNEMGRGTIVFPAHSAEGAIEYPVEEFIADVQREMPGPYTVSIYIQDAETPAVDAYRRAGFRLVSFGSRMRPDFLHALATEIAAHEAVVSNVAQTSVWYGALMGRNVRVIGPGAFPVQRGQDPETARQLWPALFESGVSLEDTIAMGRKELGADHLLTPRQLRAALGLTTWSKAATATAIRRAIDLRLARSTREKGYRVDGLDGDRSAS